jgi:hypothetical protein
VEFYILGLINSGKHCANAILLVIFSFCHYIKKRAASYFKRGQKDRFILIPFEFLDVC